MPTFVFLSHRRYLARPSRALSPLRPRAVVPSVPLSYATAAVATGWSSFAYQTPLIHAASRSVVRVVAERNRPRGNGIVHSHASAAPV